MIYLLIICIIILIIMFCTINYLYNKLNYIKKLILDTTTINQLTIYKTDEEMKLHRCLIKIYYYLS